MSNAGKNLTLFTSVLVLSLVLCEVAFRLINGVSPLAFTNFREARVIRVACACDSALGAPRAADSPEGPHGTAVAAMRDMAGHELDRRVVEALIVILDRAAAGT